MAYALEMKNLVADIQTSHRDRTQYLKDQKGDTHKLIAKFRGELREMARDLKNFLAESEDTRKKDFDALYKAIQDRVRVVKEGTAELMKDIRARIKDIKGDTAGLLAQFDNEMKELAVNLKDFLQRSEADRRADFQALMKDLAVDIESIRKSVKGLLTDYKAERKEAAGYWAPLARKAVRLGKAEEEKAEEEKKVEKAFKCEVCGKEFSFKIALLGHRRQHPKPEVAQPEVAQAERPAEPEVAQPERPAQPEVAQTEGERPFGYRE